MPNFDTMSKRILAIGGILTLLGVAGFGIAWPWEASTKEVKREVAEKYETKKSADDRERRLNKRFDEVEIKLENYHKKIFKTLKRLDRKRPNK